MQTVNLNNLPLKLHPIDISRGWRYWPGYIKYNRRENEENKIHQIYEVESESSYNFYKVKITLIDG